ncbi:MAG: AgmX/PglI C-terminal domain-containing protein [Pseudomonadales bacterium]|nr:AgmX/PglI C-terminal domain-containing protein [Pseudomonadales bacterium]
MAQLYSDNLILPWAQEREERNRFILVLCLVLVIFLPLALVIPMIDVPEPDRKALESIPPQLAKLLIEKQEVEQKVIEVPEPPKVEEEPVPEEKPEEIPEPEPEPEPEKQEPPKPEPPKPEIKKPQTVEQAREVAQQSGLLALQDDLADMRDTLDVGALNLQNKSLQAKTISARIPEGSSSAVSASAVSRTSGGIDTSSMQVAAETVVLSNKKDVTLEARKEEVEQIVAKAKPKALGQRSIEEIRRVFDRNQSKLYSIYNRALRKNPSLQGQLLLELVIEPSGAVSACRVVSSELGDTALERKISARVKLFNFGEKRLGQTVIKFPIDFLPT